LKEIKKKCTASKMCSEIYSSQLKNN